MADKPKTEEEIRAELKAEYDEKMAEYEANLQEETMRYRQAFAEEFGDLATLDADDPEVQLKVRNRLLRLVPDAETQISTLMKHASSETVRANLAKFVFTESIATAKSKDEEDDLRAMLKKLGTGASD